MLRLNFNIALEKTEIPNETVFDDALRLNRSYWHKMVHFKEKKGLDKKVHAYLLDFFQQRYRFEDKQNFQRIWNKVAKTTWTPKKILTAGILREIDKKFKENLIYHGQGISATPSSQSTNKTIACLVKALLHGGAFSLKQVEKRAAKAIFIAHDKPLMKEFQQELQAELIQLSTTPPKNKEEEIVWRAFLGNILALLPFSYPSNDETFIIPVLENEVCRLVNFHTEVISLNFNDLSSPMTALALAPIGEETSPILSFIGTTFPTGSGFTATLLADFSPGKSVGEVVYDRNKEKIERWVKEKKNVHVVGMSLGGAMALHMLRHHPQITRLDAYNPPGLYQKNWKKEPVKTCQVNIYCQPGDLVSKLGSWPTGENVFLYTIFPHQKGMSEAPLSAHARAYTGCEKITILRQDPKQENRSILRRLITNLHQIFGPLIYFPISSLLIVKRFIHKIHRAIKSYFKPDLLP